MLDLEKDPCINQIKKRFQGKKETIIFDNIKAFEIGYGKGANFPHKPRINPLEESITYKICD